MTTHCLPHTDILDICPGLRQSIGKELRCLNIDFKIRSGHEPTWKSARFYRIRSVLNKNFCICFAPDGRCIDTVPALAADATVQEINRDLEKLIDDTTGWSWCGDRIDLGDAVEALQYVDPLFANF